MTAFAGRHERESARRVHGERLPAPTGVIRREWTAADLTEGGRGRINGVGRDIRLPTRHVKDGSRRIERDARWATRAGKWTAGNGGKGAGCRVDAVGRDGVVTGVHDEGEGPCRVDGNPRCPVACGKWTARHRRQRPGCLVDTECGDIRTAGIGYIGEGSSWIERHGGWH